MNRLIIIGNGFDIANGLKTSYKDFIDWYWNRRVDALVGNTTKVSEDCLCTLSIKENSGLSCWDVFAYNNAYFKDVPGHKRCSGSDVIQHIKDNRTVFKIDYSPFFDTILKSIETKGWVDIENDYYRMLKLCIGNYKIDDIVSELNEQLSFLKDKLVEYLSSLEIINAKSHLQEAMIDYFNPADFSTEGRRKALDNIGLDINDVDKKCFNLEERGKLIPKRIMLLSFNYTRTARQYRNFNFVYNYIHGELDTPENIIFGYGDELDKDYQNILDQNNNNLLTNIKSVKYLETNHYRQMLELMQSAPFQVFIMGHSCGNSDRTLLNTVFEHENCISIKPFYHRWEDGTDNYLELVQNISRNFTNMKLFRDRVVNKEQCQTI